MRCQKERINLEKKEKRIEEKRQMWKEVNKDKESKRSKREKRKN